MTKKNTPKIFGTIVILLLVSSFSGYGHNAFASESNVLRIGYFPNITHAPAVIGIGNGDFQKKLRDVKIEPHVFNAGPAAIEAIFANQVDVAYVGPGSAINGYAKSDGGLRIISGVASGGASFVVRTDAGIQSPQDFVGKKFSSPQLGNTQDIALRNYLLSNGYKTSDNGGSVTVQPAANPDIVSMMLKKDIDGAWVPEPWVTTLLHQTNAKILVDERDLWSNGKFVTTNIVVRPEFLKDHQDSVKKLLEANVNEINRINSNPDQARQSFNTEIEKLTSKTIPDTQLKESFSRLELTSDPIETSLYTDAENQYKIGFLDSKPDLSGIYDLTLLNQVLKEKGSQSSTDVNVQSQSGGVSTQSSAVPEFGPVTPIVFAIAVMVIVISAAKTRVIQKL
jgi:NitT/TauT family transport system substrate-binding protein